MKRERVLVVDDDEGVRAVVVAALEREYDVECVGTGREAVASLACRRYDHLLLDCVLPDLAPAEIAEAAGRSAVPPRIVLISGQEQPALLVDAWRSGARGFVRKPFRAAELLDALAPAPVSATIDEAAAEAERGELPLDRAVERFAARIRRAA